MRIVLFKIYIVIIYTYIIRIGYHYAEEVNYKHR